MKFSALFILRCLLVTLQFAICNIFGRLSFHRFSLITIDSFRNSQNLALLVPSSEKLVLDIPARDYGCNRPSKTLY